MGNAACRDSCFPTLAAQGWDTLIRGEIKGGPPASRTGVSLAEFDGCFIGFDSLIRFAQLVVGNTHVVVCVGIVRT